MLEEYNFNNSTIGPPHLPYFEGDQLMILGRPFEIVFFCENEGVLFHELSINSIQTCRLAVCVDFKKGVELDRLSTECSMRHRFIDHEKLQQWILSNKDKLPTLDEKRVQFDDKKPTQILPAKKLTLSITENELDRMCELLEDSLDGNIDEVVESNLNKLTKMLSDLKQ